MDEDEVIEDAAEEEVEEAEPEYDEDGNEIVAEEEEAEPEEEVEPEAPATQYVPTIAAAGEDADDALLREGMTPELYEANLRVMNKAIARQMQAMQIANSHVTIAAAQHPEIFRAYGPRIQETISQLPTETRARPEAVNIAIARILMEETPTKGLGATLRHLADLAEGQAPAPKVKAPKTPIPAAQRPPSPKSGGGTVVPLRGRDADIALLMKRGHSRAAAETILSGGNV